MEENNLQKGKITLKGIALIIGAVALLLIAISISTYFLYVIPKQQENKLELERQKFEAEQAEIKAQQKKEEQEKLNEALEKSSREIALQTCLDQALLSYSLAWDDYCKIWKAEVKDTYEDCKKRLTNVNFTLQEAKDWCWINTPDYNENEDKTSCLLPNKYSTTVEERWQMEKDECYKKYPQG